MKVKKEVLAGALKTGARLAGPLTAPPWMRACRIQSVGMGDDARVTCWGDGSRMASFVAAECRPAEEYSAPTAELLEQVEHALGEDVELAAHEAGILVRSSGREGVVRTELDGKDAVAFGIADNKTGELAEWDFEVLSGLLAEIGAEHQSSTGFADYEIEPLLQGSWTPPAITELAPPEHTHAVHFDEGQHQRIVKAIEALDLKLGESSATKAESIALICDAYVAE
jgi:hypothetical protein